MITERDEWRRPILAAHEECYDETSEQTLQRSVRHILKDRYQFEDLKRLAEGRACENCLEVFPERPCAANVRRFDEVYGGKPFPLPWRQRVMQGCCPVCGSEISTEMFEALHKGTLPPLPSLEENH